MGAAAAVVAVMMTGSTPASGRSDGRPEADAAATVVDEYRVRIPQLMADQGVPGLAVALVDADEVVWVEGFGHLDGSHSPAVTADTIFGIQSISKVFTATAVVQAAAAGRLDLDEPISTYLPEFTVHSAFEEHPERSITLRMLLSHTAGFTHEAPVGNNNELQPGEFDEHVRSISDTWLRFPVGTGYAYSNLGIDLAGYILEQVEGQPFPEVLHDSLLAPLGMDRSTFDREQIRSADDRAVGHVDPYPEPPLDVGMTAAGGMYTSAADLARFLRFQLNDGSIDGHVVLDAGWMEEMREIPGPTAGAPAGYALGLSRHRWNHWPQSPDLFEHGGGGFGFSAGLWWSPPLGIGVAILTNDDDNELQPDLPLAILTGLVTEPGRYLDRLNALPLRPGATDPDGRYVPPTDMADLVASVAMARTADRATRWSSWVGAYGAPAWGVTPPTDAARFLVDGGNPYFEVGEGDDDDTVTRHRLVEVEPGVFIAENGETLDLAGPVPRWRGLRLVQLSGGPAVWQRTILAVAALVATGWLVAAAIRLLQRLRSRSSPAIRRRPHAWTRAATGVATVTALLTVATVALVAWMPGLVDSGYLGWLDLPAAERLALDLPLALAVMGGSTVVLVASGLLGRWWSSSVMVQYVALAAAAMLVVAHTSVWDLIGWNII